MPKSREKAIFASCVDPSNIDIDKATRSGHRSRAKSGREHQKLNAERNADADEKDRKNRVFEELDEKKETGSALAQKVLDGEDLNTTEIAQIDKSYAVRRSYIAALKEAGHGPESYAQQFTNLQDIADGKMMGTVVTKSGDIVEVPPPTNVRRLAANDYLSRMNDVQGLNPSANKESNTNFNIVVVFDRDYDREADNSKPVEVISETTGPDEFPPDS